MLKFFRLGKEGQTSLPNRRRFYAVAFLFSSLLLRTSAEPLTYFMGPRKAVVGFRLTPEGKSMVSVVVNRTQHRFFLDTGATTILDLGVARELGLNPIESDEMVTGVTGVVGKRWLARINLQIGGLKITSYPVSCLDLTELRRISAKGGAPAMDGLIGSDLMMMLRAQIDYRTMKVTLRRPEHRSR